MLSNGIIMQIAKEQLAIEYNCLPEDLDRKENVVTLRGLHEKRRMFSEHPLFFKMVTMGGNAVISADKQMHDWLFRFIRDNTGHRLFETP